MMFNSMIAPWGYTRLQGQNATLLQGQISGPDYNRADIQIWDPVADQVWYNTRDQIWLQIQIDIEEIDAY